MAHGDSPHDNPEVAAEMSYNSDQFCHIFEQFPEDPSCNVDKWQCINCGALADTVQEIKHFPGCNPGEAKKWEDFYNEAYEEERLECFNCGQTFMRKEQLTEEVDVSNFNVNGQDVGKRILPKCPHCGAVALVGFNEV
jgi:uncharacterized C2H2 Zn-finger protein